MSDGLQTIFRTTEHEIDLIIDDLRNNLKDCKRSHRSVVAKKKHVTHATLGIVHVPGGGYGNNVFGDPYHLNQNPDGSYNYPTGGPFD